MIGLFHLMGLIPGPGRLAAKLTVALLVALAVVIGAYTLHQSIYQRGWDAHAAKVVESDRVRDQAIRADLFKSIAETLESDTQTIKKLEHLNAQQSTAMRSLQKRMLAQKSTPFCQEPRNEPSQPQPPPLLGQSVLDDGTVQLLDRARAGLPENPGAAERGDAEGTSAAITAPFITGGDLALNDLAVVGEYHRLATRHDALVDWVSKQLSERPLEPSQNPR